MMRYWAIADDAAVEVTMEELQTWRPGATPEEWFAGVAAARGNPAELAGVVARGATAGMHLVPLAPRLVYSGIDPRG